MILYLGTKSTTFAPVAELDRVFGYEPKGQGFESLLARHVKNLFCLVDKRGFLQLYPFLPERVIYAFGIRRNGYYIMLAAGKYIIRQRRISYCASDISLKSAAKRDIISSINWNIILHNNSCQHKELL